MLSNQHEPGSMKRVIGLMSGILMVPGIIIGTGIFKELAPMARGHLSDTMIIVVWMAAGIITLLGALSVSSLSELTTESGGEYEYLRIAYGKLIAFLFGWTSFIIIGSASVSAMSMIVMQSLKDIFPATASFGTIDWQLLSCVLIISLSIFNVLSTRKSVGFNHILTVFKFAGLILLIIGGFFLFHQSDPNKVVPATSNETSLNGVDWIKPFMAAMMSAFWAYDGWLSIAFMGGEIKNPRKNLPIAIVSGVLIVIVLYVLVNMAILRVLPASELAKMNPENIPATEMSQLVFGNIGNNVMSLLILICSLGALNGIIITYSRMYYKMSQDGLFFKTAGKLHRKFETPYISLLLSMIVSCLLVFAGTFEVLTSVIVFAGYFFYTLLSIAAIRYRWLGRIANGGIVYDVASIIFILFSFFLLTTSIIDNPVEMMAGVFVMLLGVPFYFYFKSRQSAS